MEAGRLNIPGTGAKLFPDTGRPSPFNEQLAVPQGNYAYNTVELTTSRRLSILDEEPREVTVYIPPQVGDLLTSLTLALPVPKLLVPMDATYACWTEALGYAYLGERVDLLLDDVIIQSLWPRTMEVLGELRNALDFVLRTESNLAQISNSSESMTLMINFAFFFNESLAVALPLASLGPRRLTVRFTPKPFGRLVNTDGPYKPMAATETPDASLWADVVSYASIPRWTGKLVNAIEKTVLIADVETGLGDRIKIPLRSLRSACSEIYVVLVETRDLDDHNCYFAYTDDVATMTLSMSGRTRTSAPGFVYRVLHNRRAYGRVPDKFIYTISFSASGDHRGFMDFSEHSDCHITLERKVTTPSRVFVYAKIFDALEVSPEGVMTLRRS